MLRLKSVRALALVAGMAAVIYVVISLYLPSSRRLIFGVDKRTGKVRLVRNTVTFLPPHQFYRLPFDKREGAAQHDGLVRILSKERVPVTISYRLRFTLPGERIPDARTLVREGWSAWIRTRVGEAVSAVTQQVPLEELVSPTSQFSQRRDILRDVVARHLTQSGLQVTAFAISRMEPDRRVLLEYKRAELRRSARGVAGRVAVIGIDGADWELLNELAIDGRLPNIRALMQRGTSGALQTIQPTVSPLVWTTAATGLPPDRHGVIDFLDRQRNLPVDSFTRRSPAVWDVAEAFGRHAQVVNWWTAWPPLPGSAVAYDTPVQHSPNAIFPAELQARASQLDVPLNTVQYGQVARFLNITGREYEEAVSGGGPAHPVNVFRSVLAKTWSDHRVALSIYQQQEPLLMLMQYEGTDIVNHLFAPYHPPYREGISQENFRRYWPAVANYYAEIDRLVGEWMRVLPDDTTVILVSAHGFHWDRSRPRVPAAGRSALADHRNPGVFIAYGNHVGPGRIGAISIYDLVPTILAILGLPESTEMPGQLPPGLLKDVTPVTSVRVVSYDEFFGGRGGGSAGINPQQYTQTLQAIGHLLGPNAMQPVFEDEDAAPVGAAPQPAANWGQYAYLNNQGIDLRRQGKLKEAVDAFQAAINLNPTRPTPYLNMSMALFDRQQYTAADDVFIMAVARGLPNGERWFADFAALYRSRNMTSRAIQLLYKGKQIYPQSYVIAASLGSALMQAERYTEGLPELERALGLQPSSTQVLNNLGIFYSKRKDYARALDFWNRSLTIDPRQPAIRQAADAAQTQL